MIRIGLFTRNDLPETDPTRLRVIRALHALGAEIVTEEMTTRQAGSSDAIDAVVVLGGDGTLLRAVQHVKAEETPVLGVNLGSLGFLTEITAEEVEEALTSLVSGNYAFSWRSLLGATLVRGEEHLRHEGLNDVTIAKAATVSRIVEFTVSVGDRFVSDFRADGLIVSSPTGSTAYNLAAGGPILHPSLDAVVLTPICPHMLSNRPVVIPASSPVKIRIRSSATPVHVTVDGQWSREVTDSDELIVSRGRRRLKLVTSASRDYFEVLRTKLKWGETPKLRR
ncbi:MAG: NAD(+)/NADH kinase [Vicinamibacteria bacterium]